MSDQELEVYIEQLKQLKPDAGLLPIANCEARLDTLIGLLEELRERRLVAHEGMTDEDIKRAYDELRAKRMAMI